MKNLKNILATLVLVTVIGVSSTFAGVLVGDRGSVPAKVDEPTTSTCSTSGGGINTGVILSGVILSGVILSGVILSGVILSADGAVDVPCVLGSTD